jgi:hypothetical protein
VHKLSLWALRVDWAPLTVAEASGEVEEQRIQWRPLNNSAATISRILKPDVHSYNISGTGITRRYPSSLTI